MSRTFHLNDQQVRKIVNKPVEVSDSIKFPTTNCPPKFKKNLLESSLAIFSERTRSLRKWLLVRFRFAGLIKFTIFVLSTIQPVIR